MESVFLWMTKMILCDHHISICLTCCLTSSRSNHVRCKYVTEAVSSLYKSRILHGLQYLALNKRMLVRGRRQHGRQRLDNAIMLSLYTLNQVRSCAGHAIIISTMLAALVVRRWLGLQQIEKVIAGRSLRKTAFPRLPHSCLLRPMRRREDCQSP